MYWEPHSSSVDFCESNYRLTPWVVEPHNAWSSLFGIVFFGALGLWQTGRAGARHPLAEWRLRLSFATLLLIGLGSMGLHSTLHWVFQSSDELPMLYIVLFEVYSLLEFDAPIGKPHYPWLSVFIFLVGIVSTVVYYVLQHFYWVFLFNFAVGSVIVAGGMIYLAFGTANIRRPDTLRVAYCSLTSFVLVATPVWVLDMLFCDKGVLSLSNAYFFGITPHIVWHFCAGYGSYCGLVYLACCRCEALRKPFQVHFWWGIVPVVTANDEYDSKDSQNIQ